MEGTLFFVEEQGRAAPWPQRSLPVGGLGAGHSEYVIGDWPEGWQLTTGITAAWFGQPGGGKRVWFYDPSGSRLNVRRLINMGWLIPANEYLPAGTIVSAGDPHGTVLTVERLPRWFARMRR